MAYTFEKNEKSIYDSLYEELEAEKAKAFSAAPIDDADDGLDGMEYRMAYTKSFLKEHTGVIVIGVLYLLCAIHAIALIVELGLAIFHLHTGYLNLNPVWLIAFSAAPFFVWLYSTKYAFYSFENRKMGGLLLVLTHFCLQLSHHIYNLIAGLTFPFIGSLVADGEDVDAAMIMNLERAILIIGVIALFIIYISLYVKAINSPITFNHIMSIKITSLFDMRDGDVRKFAYDCDVVKSKKTAAHHIIKEKDRYLHSLLDGTTGTGKTSSIMVVQIAKDIVQIDRNLEYQKKTVQKWLKEGRVRMKAPMDDRYFTLDNFEPVSKADKDLITDLKYGPARLAGITAMAPNAAFSDEIFKLAEGRGLAARVKRLDPTLGEDGRLKKGYYGFNPLYIDPNLSLFDRIIEVNKKAVLFADVTQAIYDATGKTDPYFASLNKNITVTVVYLLCLTYPYMEETHGRQPTPADVQDILNDFGRAEKYLNKMVEMWAVKDPKTHQIKNKMHPDLGMFQSIYDCVHNDMLGENRAQLSDQCRGLRNLVDSFLRNPLIRNSLCAENTVDLDQCLRDGEIILVNYALELGTEGIAFGLFFMLSFIDAVLRRPGTEDTRLPNFFYVDEFPQLLHPRVEPCFSLFRQYRCAMMVAIQSLSQMDKSDATKFLKPLLTGNCAHHFVFGRVDVDDMKLYQSLAGTGLKIMEMEGQTSQSLTMENPTKSYSSRSSMQRDNNVEGSDIHYMDFQDILLLTVDNGSPVAAFKGKVAFLPRYKRIKRKPYRVDWNDAYLDMPVRTKEIPKSVPEEDSQREYADSASMQSFRKVIASEEYKKSTTDETEYIQDTVAEKKPDPFQVIFSKSADGENKPPQPGKDEPSGDEILPVHEHEEEIILEENAWDESGANGDTSADEDEVFIVLDDEGISQTVPSPAAVEEIYYADKECAVDDVDAGVASKQNQERPKKNKKKKVAEVKIQDLSNLSRL